MSKKSETLRQREKAQKDLLELKKIQSGEIDPETLRDDDKKIVPKTLDEKCDNFFFYHKYKLIFAAVAAIALTIIITSTITKPKYDASVTIYCYEYVDEQAVKDTSVWMEGLYTDVNENGKVDILVTDCSFATDTELAETLRTKQLKIQSLLLEEDALLFILDDDSLKYLNSISDSVTLFSEENIVKLGDSYYNKLSDNRYGMLEEKNRYLCLRTVDGTTIEGKAKTHLKAAKAVLEKVRNSEK